MDNVDSEEFPLKAHQNEVEAEEFLSHNFEAQAKKYKVYEEAVKQLNNLVFDTKYYPYYIHSFQIHGAKKNASIFV